VVLAAGETGSRESREALAILCEAYWYPVYAFIRRNGYDPDGARDLTQSYFVTALEKNYIGDARPDVGRFRSFLLASVKHFLSKERERVQALKRGGGHAIVSLDLTAAEERYASERAGIAVSPEALFERRWALTVLERSMARLEREFEDAGKLEQLNGLRPHLTGEGRAVPYRELAEQLGTSESAIKVTVHRSRRRFGELLRAEIAETVAKPDDVDDEVRYLLRILQGG
jgi:RNA polymerase sigma-70 factor (ECF subfamily)